MRALLVFLLGVALLSTVLWLTDTKRAERTQLPEERLPVSEPAVLVGADLADEYGTAPFGGRLRRLTDFRLRVVEEDYVKIYFNVGRLARHDGRPRLEQVTGAVFDPPVEGKPNLRVTLHAPFVAGDLRTLLHASQDAPRLARFYGGVVVRDPTGRDLAHVETLRVDLTHKTIASDDRVHLRLPDQGAEVRGTGLFADLELREAHLRRDVTADVVRKDQRVTLSCAGTAALAEVADDHVRAILRDEARIVHSFGAATCDEIRADVEGGALARAELAGRVELQLDAAATRGLESASMAGLLLEDENHLDCVGPVAAVWRGEAGPLGLGERTVDLEAGSATFLLGRDAEDHPTLEQAGFDAGVVARDRDGPGRLSADTLSLERESGRLVATGEVFLKSAEGELRAGRLELWRPEQDRYELAVSELDEIAYVADGKLGPLGHAARGTLHLRTGGTMRVAMRGTTASFSADRGVSASIDQRSSLEAARLEITVEDEKLARFDATGDVRISDTERAAEARGDRVAYADGAARIEGQPAYVHAAERGTVTARTLTYRDDQTFAAERDAKVEAPLSLGDKAGELWTFRCARARGKLAQGGVRQLRADGGVVAEGPAGEHAEAASFEFDGKTGRGTLSGSPARLRRGRQLQLVAEAFEFVAAKNTIVKAETRGKAAIRFLPHDTAKAAAFARWEARLLGPAQVAEKTLTVARGGHLQAYDKDGKLALEARANRVEGTLVRTGDTLRVEQVRGLNGVEITSLGDQPATVTADRLVFTPGSNRVDVHGNAKVETEGETGDVRFEHLVFLVTEDGIDLKRMSRIRIRGDAGR